MTDDKWIGKSLRASTIGEYPNEKSNRHINISGNGMSDTYIVLYVHRGLHIAVCNEGMNAFACTRPPGHHAGSYGCTSGCLNTGFCLLNNAAIAVVYATDSIGMINKLFVGSTGSLEALESVIIPQMERFRLQLLIISGTSQHVHPSIDSFIHSTISSIHPSTHPSHLFIHPTIYPFIYSSIHSFINLSFIHPSIYSSFHSSTHLFNHLSTHFFIHLFIHGSYLYYVYVYVSSAAGFDGYTSDPLGGQLCLSMVSI